MRRLLLSISLLLIPTLVSSLTCQVCGTGDLDEFGECRGQFQYDCTPYASKFAVNERIYCRTTREKQRNGTYTVKKECISETDHYAEFPNKGYPLEEECDLVDIRGEEVAYCLCRKSMCNDAAMAEQFMAFEERHPELFGDLENSREGSPIEKHSKNSLSPVAAFAAPSLTPQAIVPINDPRFSMPSSQSQSSSAENQRSQLPSRATDGIMKEIGRQIALPTRDDSGMIMLPNLGPVSHSGFVGTVGAAQPSSNIPRPPASPPTVIAAGRKTQIQTSPIPVPANALHCMQCGDHNLASESSDCARSSSTECSAADTLCFTRMIVMAPGSHKVEKMCVSTDAVRAMFGDEVIGEECGTASQGKEKFCTCSTSNCNNLSIAEQIILHSPPPPEAFLPDVPRQQLPEVKRPTMEEPEFLPPVREEPTASRMLMPPTDLEGLRKSVKSELAEDKSLMEENAPMMKPIVPVAVNKPAMPSKSTQPSPRCSSCLQSDISDPTADCTVSSPLECPLMSSGGAFCMTKQTQNGQSFSMEKRCISREEFRSLLPSESYEEGCAVSGNGMVNFCLCKGDLCNKESLLQQAQSNGVREPFEAAKKMFNHEKPMLPAPPQIHMNRFEEETPRMEIPEPGTNEDHDIAERRKQWAKADLNSSNGLSLLTSFFITLYLFW